MLVHLGKFNFLDSDPQDIAVSAESVLMVTLEKVCKDWVISIVCNSLRSEAIIRPAFTNQQDAISARNRIVSQINSALEQRDKKRRVEL